MAPLLLALGGAERFVQLRHTAREKKSKDKLKKKQRETDRPADTVSPSVLERCYPVLASAWAEG